MIAKSLDQLAKELEDTIKRISEITDLENFYKDQQIILNQKEEEELYEAPPADEKLLFWWQLSCITN